MERNKRVSLDKDSFERIPMDVVVQEIFSCLLEMILSHHGENQDSTTIKRFYGYFTRDRTRKIFFLRRSVAINATDENIRIIKQQRIENLQQISVISFFPKTTSLLLANSHRTRNLKEFEVLCQFENCENLFSKIGCFPNLKSLKLTRMIRFVETKKWVSSTHIIKNLQNFSFSMPHDINQDRFPFLFEESVVFQSLIKIRLDNVNLRVQGQVLKSPILRHVYLEKCSNFRLMSPKIMRVGLKDVEKQFCQDVFSQIKPSLLETLSIEFSEDYEETAITNDPEYNDFSFLFEGEIFVPLSKFKKLVRIELTRIVWSSERFKKKTIFPDCLNQLKITASDSLDDREHVNWGSLITFQSVSSRAFPPDQELSSNVVNLTLTSNTSDKIDDFFINAKFTKLGSLVLQDCPNVTGKNWDPSFRSKLSFIGICDCSSSSEDVVNALFGGSAFLNLEFIILGMETKRTTNWGNVPQLKSIRCCNEFWESLCEKNEGNINFENVKHVSMEESLDVFWEQM